jgi:uncharacterized protein YdaU (DUF1376 family)
MLLLVAWRSPDCRLPQDDARLARYARCSTRRWRAIKDVILPFFSIDEDGFLVQKKLSKVRLALRLRASVNRENGAKGGRPKSLKNNDTENPNGSVSDNPNHNRKKPSISKGNKEKEIPNGISKKKGSRLPEDWHPNESHDILRIKLGFGVDEARTELSKFRDYWLSKAGQQATKLDWDRTFNNWLRTAAERRRPAGRSDLDNRKEGFFRAAAEADAKEGTRHDEKSTDSNNPGELFGGLRLPEGR